MRLDSDQDQEEQQQPTDAQAEAALQAGFNKVRGEADGDGNGDAAPEKSDAQTQADPEAQAKAEAEAAAKAKADAEEAERAAEAERRSQVVTRGELEKLVGQVQSIAGHVGGLKNATTRIEQAIKAAKTATTEAGDSGPSNKQVQSAMRNPEAMNRLLEDFPEFKVLADELEALRSDGRAPVDQEAVKKDVMGDVSTVLSGAVAEAEERAFLRLKHPDWKQIAKQGDFASWLGQQPDDIKQKADSKFADDAIVVFDAYRAHTKAVQQAQADQQRRQTRLQRAITPSGTGVADVAVGIPDEEAFARGFKKVRGK